MDDAHAPIDPGPVAAAAAEPAPDEGAALAAFDLWAAKVLADPTLLPRAPNVDAVTAWRNCRKGVGAVLADREAISLELPKAEWAKVEAAPTVALALVAAVARCQRASGDQGEVATLYTGVAASRGLLLDSASSLARKGLLPSADVARIRKGRGNVDAAQDCLALVALFRTNAAAIAGKSAVEDVSGPNKPENSGETRIPSQNRQGIL